MSDRNAIASTRVVRLAATLAILATAGFDATRADADGPGRGNFVYVEGDDPAGNAIYAYNRDAAGKLTPLAGSPFSARGKGVTPTFNLGPFDSDGNIVVDRSRELLFAVNGGSDTIAVFKIAEDGSLTHVDGSPFPSGGPQPVSVGLSDDVLTVINKGEDPGRSGQGAPNYTTFRVTRRGALVPIHNSTYVVDLGSSPTQALPAPEADLVFGADFFGGLLRSFEVRPGGRLEPTAAVALPAGEFAGGAPPFPLGLAAHPEERLLYVGFVTINRIGVYRYGDEGALHYVRSIADSGAAPCWLLVNREATRLYASNTADPSVTVYDIERDPAHPVEIQKVVLRSTGSCFQFAFDPAERFLQVVTQQAAAAQPGSANALNVLKILHDGTLAEVPSSPTQIPVRNGVRPQGVATY